MIAEQRRRLVNLTEARRIHAHELKAQRARKEELDAYLRLAPQVDTKIQDLSHQILDEDLNDLETYLTRALNEVLEQPLVLRAASSQKSGYINVDFHVDNMGKSEDILRGQGGSVANILSVGLRMFALSKLLRDGTKHRRFLVLDEQDCWIKPELVPRLVKIIHEAGTALGFQVLLISHHDVSVFEQFAEKLYLLRRKPDGSVSAELVTSSVARDVEPGTKKGKRKA